MLALGVDTSNYATSLAVVNTTSGEVICALKQLLEVGEGEKGLRQSDALFRHVSALPQMTKKLAAKVPLSKIEAVGVSFKPRPAEGSYMPCFLAGVEWAVAFSAGLNITPHYTTHQQGHLASALFGTAAKELFNEELLFFHISGGTTELLLTSGYEILATIGQSLDLYAGQAVDRLGVKLGHTFPAGPAVSALAANCSEEIKPKAKVVGTNCHLSGLENQCNTLLENGKSPEYAAKFCLLSVAETVAKMLEGARMQYPKHKAVLAGGVMSSEIIKYYVTARCKNVYFVPPEFSSDNAVGAALIAAKEAENG